MGDKRTVRRFLFLPMTLLNKDTDSWEMRWLEVAEWEQVLESSGRSFPLSWRDVGTWKVV